MCLSHSIMGSLQYRGTVWICQLLCQDSDIPQTPCSPVSLFVYLENHGQRSWGRYALYITWLHKHFPVYGEQVFGYLKTHYSSSMYSVPYLARQYLMYHVAKGVHAVRRSFSTRFTRRR